MQEDNRPEGARVTMDMVGSTGTDKTVSWEERDTMLYALSIGASLDDPLSDLSFTTENSRGLSLRTIPSMLTVVGLRGDGGGSPPAMAKLDFSRYLHAGQGIELLRPLPAAGRGIISSTVEKVADNGSGAFVTTVSTLRADDADGAPLARLRSTAFIRGGGGFGGPPGDAAPWTLPDHAPDARTTYSTRPDQALLYRLNGDRNPLHSDPAQARAVGFDRPILHGLCTFGFTCRALIAGAAQGDPERLTAMDGRFSKPVYPGEPLTVEMWRTGPEEVLFRTLDSQGNAVFDRGVARIAG